MYNLSVDLVRSHRHHHVGAVIRRQTFIGELILDPVLDLAVTPGQTTKLRTHRTFFDPCKHLLSNQVIANPNSIHNDLTVCSGMS